MSLLRVVLWGLASVVLASAAAFTGFLIFDIAPGPRDLRLIGVEVVPTAGTPRMFQSMSGDRPA